MAAGWSDPAELAVANETFKFMPILSGTTMLEVSFLSAATGKESVIETIKLLDTMPLVATAHEAGTFIARSKADPSATHLSPQRPPIFLRVEQAYVAQTSQQLATEYRELWLAYKGTRYIDASIFRLVGILPDVIR